MQLRPLGDSALKVTPIGLGLAALGRPGYINLGHDKDLGKDKSVGALERQAHEVLDAAWSNGIRYFDVARSYGKAEEFLGNWLRAREIAPDEVVVGSKWGYRYTADWQVEAGQHEVKEHSLETLQRQVVESWQQLGEQLDLYQIHSATMDSGVLENQAVLDELGWLRAKGLVIGLTLSGPMQAETLEQAMDIERDGRRLFGMVQATWNVLEPSAGSMLGTAHREGMGVILKEVLANGRLTQRNEDAGFGRQMAILGALANELQCGIDALAMAAALAQPWADMVLSGAAQVDHLLPNLSAVNLELSQDDLDLLSELAERREDYWDKRSALSWN